MQFNGVDDEKSVNKVLGCRLYAPIDKSAIDGKIAYHGYFESVSRVTA